ncbi:hypothetical protein GCM10010361_52270 [Streptomyces olivaceiscleroticus]|uniref:Uncharacterized protein n=1 Tax=Streptomyces olivaceiscleroticus TaxID=68245 RepID=A0ABP3KJD2_9ACTN
MHLALHLRRVAGTGARPLLRVAVRLRYRLPARRLPRPGLVLLRLLGEGLRLRLTVRLLGLPLRVRLPLRHRLRHGLPATVATRLSPGLMRPALGSRLRPGLESRLRPRLTAALRRRLTTTLRRRLATRLEPRLGPRLSSLARYLPRCLRLSWGLARGLVLLVLSLLVLCLVLTGPALALAARVGVFGPPGAVPPAQLVRRALRIGVPARRDVRVRGHAGTLSLQVRAAARPPGQRVAGLRIKATTS